MPATFGIATVSIAGKARSYPARLSIVRRSRLRGWRLAGIQYPGVCWMPDQVRHDGLHAAHFIQLNVISNNSPTPKVELYCYNGLSAQKDLHGPPPVTISFP
jgi:hypothetical protein